MGSGKEKLGCLSPAVSSDELRGEEMHQENQTGFFFPLSFPAPFFLSQKIEVFLETVSACIKGD